MLSIAIIPDKYEPSCNGNKEILHIPQIWKTSVLPSAEIKLIYTYSAVPADLVVFI